MLLRRLTCPMCDTLVSIPAATAAGSRAACGACEGVFRVPAEGRDTTSGRQDETFSEDTLNEAGKQLRERLRETVAQDVPAAARADRDAHPDKVAPAASVGRQTISYDQGDLRQRQTTKRGGWGPMDAND